MIKKTTIITIFILFANVLIAQSVIDLDFKNGFKHFKLGSSPNDIKNIVKEKNKFTQKNSNVVNYDYIGEDISYIYNIKVDGITLVFFKNKLFKILVSFGSFKEKVNFEIYDFNDILYALEKTYGKKWVQPNNAEGNMVNIAVWEGKKVRLELVRIDFSKSKTNPKDYGYIGGYLSVFDKKIMSEMYANEF